MFSSLFSNQQPTLNFLRLVSHNIETNLTKNKNDFGKFIIWNSVDNLDSSIAKKLGKKEDNYSIEILQDGYYQFMFQGVVQKEKSYEIEKSFSTTITNYFNSLIILSKNDEPFSVYYENSDHFPNQELSSKFVNVSLVGIVQMKKNDIVNVTLGNGILPRGINSEFNLIKIS
jgi:hypothetical protein